MKDLDIVAIGEPLLEFSEIREDGAAVFKPGHGGDTSNAVIAAARLGARTGYVTALGDDAFGRSFQGLWDREGVDRQAVISRSHAPTGIYFISHGPGGHEFTYRRAGSAASLLSVGDLDHAYLARARVLHASGISQAISPGACDAVFAAMERVRASGGIVSFDPNYRPALWPVARARAIIEASIALAEIALPGEDDAKAVLGLSEPQAIADHCLKLGARIVALTLGSKGAFIATAERSLEIAAPLVRAVDATGAGDTFDGAFLTRFLECGDPFEAGRMAVVAAALSTLGHGAVAPMPRRADVDAGLNASPAP